MERFLLCFLVSGLAIGCNAAGSRNDGADEASALQNAGLAAEEAKLASDEELAAGKLIYDTHCARCHGADGKANGYPFILTLDGIGRRYTLDQILEETWATGFVAPQQFTPEEQRAMAKYVATL